MRGCVLFFWMIPWVLSGLALKTITWWIRSPITTAVQNNIFNYGCDDWDMKAILASSNTMNLDETLPSVGNGTVISWTVLAWWFVECQVIMKRDFRSHWEWYSLHTINILYVLPRQERKQVWDRNPILIRGI